MKKYPFKFLDAYGKEDADVFFGRDAEVDALYEMVFQSPILLVYGASGTGKTSLIQCGLASRFQSHDWLALPVRRGGNLNDSLQKALADAGGSTAAGDESMDWLSEVMEEGPAAATAVQPSPLLRSVRAIYLRSFRPLYLIFDQFEELFILGTTDEQDQFVDTVKELLQAETPVKLIFSIREEYLGCLNRFERAVPQLLRKKLRVEPMTLDTVRQVVVGAATYEGSNVRLQNGESEALAEGIFDKIKGDDRTLAIQLPYLQVFLDKLYLNVTGDETRQSEAVFTLAALRRIGDIGDVLRNFLEEQVAAISKKLGSVHGAVTAEGVWNLLSPFATLEGTKEPISSTALYDRFPATNKAVIDDALEAFIGSRILRYAEDEGLYELAHDSLAKRIAEKRSDEEIALLEIKRLLKNQIALKEDAREVFSEKQLNFIEPFLEKINPTEEEARLIAQSREAVRKQKEARLKQQEAEAERLRERQQLLEKTQRVQRRFISVVTLALLVAVALAYWAMQQRSFAVKNANNAETAKHELLIAFDKIKVEQALSAAREFKNFGDSYRDLGRCDYARESYQKGLDTLVGYAKDSLSLYLELDSLKHSLKCN